MSAPEAKKKRLIEIPELALVAMVGASGSGKSTFAKRHFAPTEVLSSDFFRGLVSDDENDQAATKDAFDALYYLLEKRLSRGRLTVVDATNVRADDRKRLIQTARKYHVMAVALVVMTPERVCQERNRLRPDRQFGPHVVRNQSADLRRGLRSLEREGFRYVHLLNMDDEVEIQRAPLWSNRKSERGPFDIIGDIHGCADELRALLGKLGWERYEVDGESATPTWGAEAWRHPAGRKAMFLGDLVDRGPAVLDVLRIARNMITAGHAYCVAGNHDVKLMRWLRGNAVQVKHGLAESIAEMEKLDEQGRAEVGGFLDSLIGHYVFDGGKLVMAHAGLREEMHGRASAAVREFCLYGETTGETDEFGLPVRYNWASEYRGKAMVVYGHTPVPAAEWLNNTVNIDTGAVFGGKLTALRYPEREFVSVPAAREYAVPARPIAVVQPARTAQQELDDVLDIEDVTGKRLVETRLMRNLTIREENSIAALEVMSRFATDPHWLIYLPPTMSPSETSARADYLEYPEEAFAYFAANGVERVVCEEKHMGSRAVVIVCRSPEAAQARFGVIDGRAGVCYTRTGRPFFAERPLEQAFIDRVRAAVDRAGLWEQHRSDWFCFDCELMPWSAKARELLQRQYAAVAAAGIATSSAAVEALKQCPPAGDLLQAQVRRLGRLQAFREAYRRYCWPVNGLEDYRLAPFHLLASEGAVHSDKTHRWHLDAIHAMAATDSQFLMATPYIEVDTGDSESVRRACEWWEQLTAKGGEGMVVKPADFITQGPKGIVQPALKCRGREYLRIIYGPEYTDEAQMNRLRKRAVGAKRSLASREFALGIEALERFVAREPLRRVHECVFGVLALESEPVDPRL